MAPHDLPFGYDPDISSGDVAFYELEAIGNFYYTHFDWEFGALAETEAPYYVTQEDEEDWDSEYPPVTPYVPSAEVVARVDELIREMTDRANLLTFGTTDPRDEHYEEFFRHFSKCHTRFRYDDEDDEDEDEGLW